MSEYESSTQKRKTKSVYVSTVISIALVLLVTGLLGLLLVHAKNLSKYVKENIVLNVIVNDGTNEGDVLSLQKDLEKDKYVLRTEYISKELAAKSLKEDLGEDFVQYLGHNPLLPSIDVYMKEDYANSDSIKTFIDKISRNTRIKEVVYQESLIDMVNKNVRIISIVVLAFAAIFIVVIAIGILISGLSTYFAVTKYLKAKSNDLYS